MASSDRPITLAPLETSESDINRLADRLINLASSCHVELTLDQARLCVEHLLYVEQINQYINLTRITDINEALVLHILDSLSLVPLIDATVTRFLDMGTGAGFPGVPLHVATGLPGVLLDSVGKKIKAVNACLKQLGIDRITGVHDRLESYAAENKKAFDLVVARAVAPLPILIEYASPFLKHRGQLLISKGNPDSEELAQGRNAAKLCGMELQAHESFDLPDGFGHRELYSFVQVSKPTIKLPRSVGEARKRPLGQ